MSGIDARITDGLDIAPFTTLEVGGAARHFCTVEHPGELEEALAWAERRGLPVAILGGGSNVVVSDAGFDGLVIRLGLKGLELTEDGTGPLLEAAAGEAWDDFVAWCVDDGFTGIECLSGIPGTVGASPVQNIGAYGQEVADVIASIEALDRRTGSTVRLEPRDCAFTYRSSTFRLHPDRWVILSIAFRLSLGRMKSVAYDELRQKLGNHLVPPSPSQIREVVLELRREKSMLAEASDRNRRSVGSFFVNPVLGEADADRVRSQARRIGAGRRFPGRVLPDGRVKIPAAWLIEKAGFTRGARRGRVGLSDRHALCLVNLGGATASELLDLAREIRDGVEASFGVVLRPEPVFIGFGENPL